MAEVLSSQFDDDEVDALEEMQRCGDADNYSEALRRATKTGLQELGYQNGENADTTLKWLSGEFARAFAWIGIAWVGLTLLLPIRYRVGAVFAVFAAAGCSGLYVALDQHEPGVTNWMRGLLGGESA